MVGVINYYFKCLTYKIDKWKNPLIIHVSMNDSNHKSLLVQLENT